MSVEIIKRVEQLLPYHDLKLISQGAEALVFITTKHPYLPKNYKSLDLSTDADSSKYIIKYRPPKPYRHEILDKQITKSRTASEAKILNKLTILNFKTPKLISMDAPHGLIIMEYIGYDLNNGDISSLKNHLWLLEKQQESNNYNPNVANDASVESLLKMVGERLGELHLYDIVHGDLTSSNIMLIKDSESETGNVEPTLIDFGLSSYSSLSEDKAVDLYVLERALISTHPVYATQYNEWMLEGYCQAYKAQKSMKRHVEVIRRLEGVRLRGRKRSLLG
ncbi:hypothetical protein CANARDRAFT_8402 [[Candida] arabinofermentans NRRL YB-2248]|uniref:EKC/KEOPS complex subunit BUD32 n=1 Tax=[Candida] arabinofermentans NRRL YB-2248 TaxID=983967 RepID=A0A1E4SZE4_9ASCO|nr:hypothetical protein CANARDRAFT_8402 [[Candida] arabinofermentans NRRL YB-2248]